MEDDLRIACDADVAAATEVVNALTAERAALLDEQEALHTRLRSIARRLGEIATPLGRGELALARSRLKAAQEKREELECPSIRIRFSSRDGWASARLVVNGEKRAIARLGGRSFAIPGRADIHPDDASLVKCLRSGAPS